MSNSLKSYNLNAETLTHIKNVLAINSRFYSGIRIRCVAIQTNSDEKWHNALCIITAFSKEAMPERHHSLRYKRVHIEQGEGEGLNSSHTSILKILIEEGHKHTDTRLFIDFSIC